MSTFSLHLSHTQTSSSVFGKTPRSSTFSKDIYAVLERPGVVCGLQLGRLRGALILPHYYGESRASQHKAAVSSPIGEIREQLSEKNSGQLSKVCLWLVSMTNVGASAWITTQIHRGNDWQRSQQQ